MSIKSYKQEAIDIIEETSSGYVVIEKQWNGAWGLNHQHHTYIITPYISDGFYKLEFVRSNEYPNSITPMNGVTPSIEDVELVEVEEVTIKRWQTKH